MVKTWDVSKTKCEGERGNGGGATFSAPLVASSGTGTLRILLSSDSRRRPIRSKYWEQIWFLSVSQSLPVCLSLFVIYIK